MEIQASYLPQLPPPSSSKMIADSCSNHKNLEFVLYFMLFPETLYPSHQQILTIILPIYISNLSSSLPFLYYFSSLSYSHPL